MWQCAIEEQIDAELYRFCLIKKKICSFFCLDVCFTALNRRFSC